MSFRLPADDLMIAAGRFADRPALVGVDNIWTFRSLMDRAQALAVGFQEMAPDPRARIAICAYNSAEHVTALLAVLLSGRTWVPLNPRLGADELTRIIQATSPGLIYADDDCLDRFEADQSRVLRGRAELEAMIGAHHGWHTGRPDLGPDDTQAIKFTGGSSGAPKGVEQSVLNWRTCIDAMIDGFGFDQDERNLLAAPITHGTGTLIVPILAQGGCHVCLPQPSKPAGIIEALESESVTSVYLPPTVIYMMMAEAGVEARDYSTLKHMIIGGAAMRPAEIGRGLSIFNGAVETCFGQTEVPQIVTCMRANDWRENEERRTSCGRAVAPSEVRIAGATLEETAPTGETGEILIRGPLVMKGYLDRPEQTAETIVDGWLRTGDVGSIDSDGFVYIRDRIRDVIVTGGFNVFPTDVEAILGTHPAIKECVVFGVEDPKWGEAVQAAVELHNGHDVTSDTLIDHVKAQADSIKAPKAVYIVDSLPRSAVGKVLRRAVKEQFGSA